MMAVSIMTGEIDSFFDLKIMVAASAARPHLRSLGKVPKTQDLAAAYPVRGVYVEKPAGL